MSLAYWSCQVHPLCKPGFIHLTYSAPFKVQILWNGSDEGFSPGTATYDANTQNITFALGLIIRCILVASKGFSAVPKQGNRSNTGYEITSFYGSLYSKPFKCGSAWFRNPIKVAICWPEINAENRTIPLRP
jgi:hypothetical protein